MQEAKMRSTNAKRLMRGSFVLTFLTSCSSNGTQTPAPSGAALSTDTTTNVAPSVPGTGGNPPPNTDVSPTNPGGVPTGTNTGSGPPGNTGGPTGPTAGDSASESGSPTEVNTGNGESNAGPTGSAATSEPGGSDTPSTGGAVTDGATTETSAGESGGPSGPAVTVLLAGNSVDNNGPLPTVQENLSFSDGGHILVRPTNITTEPNTKHPVAIWGPGGGTPPSDYLQLLTRMASQGFVIVAIRESTGDSILMSAAIDWLEQQNADANSPMYDRLILNRVGVFGHSMGGLSSEATALADDRVATALLDNSGSFSHDALVNVTIPVGIIYGETGQERPNAEGDFNNAGNKGPCWLSMMAGGGHGSGPWDGASANVAWMRWHIGGENSRKDAFIGNGGAYTTGIWQTQFKNWDGWKNWNE